MLIVGQIQSMLFATSFPMHHAWLFTRPAMHAVAGHGFGEEPVAYAASSRNVLRAWALVQTLDNAAEYKALPGTWLQVAHQVSGWQA